LIFWQKVDIALMPTRPGVPPFEGDQLLLVFALFMVFRMGLKFAAVN
jgi:hypothetical protein